MNGARVGGTPSITFIKSRYAIDREIVEIRRQRSVLAASLRSSTLKCNAEAFQVTYLTYLSLSSALSALLSTKIDRTNAPFLLFGN